MKIAGCIVLLFASACCSATSRDREPIVNGPYAFDTFAVTLNDSSRNREVPIRVYAPRGPVSLLPVVVFSHGIGESRDSYKYLGEELASHGMIAIHVTHHGTDADVLRDKGFFGLYREVKKSENWRNRPLDVTLVLDRIEAGDVAELKGRADLSRVAVAGHSAGVFTALALAGLHLPNGELMRDRRVRTVVAMSLPKFSFLKPEDYRDIDVPVLHVTGTRDRSLLYRTFPRDRRVAFDNIPSTAQILVTLRGATHSTFSNPEVPGGCEAHLHSIVRQLTTRFVTATLPSARVDFGELARSLKDIDPAVVKIETK